MTKRMVTLPSREVPVLAEADIVVVGGGSAGVAAAVAASRLGVSCLLIEKSSCAGGTLTNGLLPSIISMEDGVKVLSSGLCKTLVDRAYAHCRKLLQENEQKLQQVTAFLLENENMTGAPFAACMEGKPIEESSVTSLFDGIEE
jgi:thioredoxin reductase